MSSSSPTIASRRHRKSRFFAARYDRLRAWRFPDPDALRQAFHQIVLVGVKRKRAIQDRLAADLLSSDAPNAPPHPKCAPSGRKPGGQKGHTGHGCKLVPIEQVKRVIDLKPTGCDQCRALLMGEDAQPVQRQVTELPRSNPK
jgi:hypothetical protein